MKKEKLFRALGDIGSDLIEMAETRTFTNNGWRRWCALAASLAVVLCLSALALPYFPMGCGSSMQDSTNMSTPETETMDQNSEMKEEEDEAVPEEAPKANEKDDALTENSEKPDDGIAQIVVMDGRQYFVTGHFAPEELTEQDIGEYLGEVEDASDETWIGCSVYSYRENQKKAILVELPDEYLYCTLPLE